MSNQTEPIVDGTIKIFKGKKADVSSTNPAILLDTLTSANADGSGYKFSEILEGDYTFSATAPGKGLFVGGFVVPHSSMRNPNTGELESFTKFIPPILLTPPVTDGVVINLINKDGDPVTSGVRVLVSGIDAIHGSGGVWTASNVPVTNNGVIEIIPADPTVYQNYITTKPFTDTNREFTITLFPPFRFLVNVINQQGNSLNTIAKVFVKAPGREFVEIYTGDSGQFVMNNAADGSYQVRVEAPNFETRTMNYTLTYSASGVVTRTIMLNSLGATMVSWQLNMDAGITVFNPAFVSPSVSFNNGILTALEGTYLTLEVVDTMFGTHGPQTLVMTRNSRDTTNSADLMGTGVTTSASSPVTIFMGTMESNKVVFISRRSSKPNDPVQ